MVAIGTTNNNQTSNGHFYCSSQKDTLYDRFLDPYFQWIDLIFYAILPFITMAICSFFIIRAMFASNRRLTKTMNLNTSNLVVALKASFEQNANNAAAANETNLDESGLFTTINKFLSIIEVLSKSC